MPVRAIQKEVRMHSKERVPRVLAAVVGTARAMRRHKRRTPAAGVALLLVTPLLDRFRR